MGRRYRGYGRHADLGVRRLSHRVAALPWISIVLVTGLVLGGTQLLLPVRYAASAALSAPDSLAASQAREDVPDPALVARVEEAVELADDERGQVELRVADDPGLSYVVIQSRAPDPRLAALAADTAVALLVEDRGAGYGLERTAVVPSEPEQPRSLRWAWLTLLALIVATWVERSHRAWLGRHLEAVSEGAR